MFAGTICSSTRHFPAMPERRVAERGACPVPLPDLSGPGEHPENHPLHVGVVLAQLDALDAAREFAHAHRDCDDEGCACQDAEGLIYNLELYTDILSGGLVPSAAVERKEQELQERRKRWRAEVSADDDTPDADAAEPESAADEPVVRENPFYSGRRMW